MFVAGAISQYLGAAIAIPLFDQADPVVVAWMRTVFAGLVIWGVVGGRSVLADAVRRNRAIGFGLVTLGMNTAFYLAISRIDLGVAVAVEFIGPIAVAAVAVRGWRGAAAVVATAAGVALVSGATPSGSWSGVVWALVAGALWAGYIVLGARVSAGATGSNRRPSSARAAIEELGVGLTAAGLLAAPLVLGVSLVTESNRGGVALCVASAGIGVAVLSSAVPYALDQLVLTRIPRAHFALMLALLPVTAVAVAAVTLRQVPSAAEFGGIALIVAAIVTSARTDRASGDVPG
ncbi:EamA family transporter [Williamsia sp. CHRR-6]|uniref:EamA family transporter n=1 Tax=Williamsia sp. CHRR-6 TaxID=2835871 RepID=UPI0027DAF760|nr:EamA family transporter [Williamsia sp. CHRR-6]